MLKSHLKRKRSWEISYYCCTSLQKKLAAKGTFIHPRDPWPTRASGSVTLAPGALQIGLLLPGAVIDPWPISGDSDLKYCKEHVCTHLPVAAVLASSSSNTVAIDVNMRQRRHIVTAQQSGSFLFASRRIYICLITARMYGRPAGGTPANSAVICRRTITIWIPYKGQLADGWTRPCVQARVE